MTTSTVSLLLPHDRHARCGNDEIILPAATELSGQLSLEPSDGPFGIREYEHPSYVATTFEFAGRSFRNRGLLSAFHLWAPNGTPVQLEAPDYQEQLGPIEGMMDDREDWWYLLPDGTKHTNRLKYTSCQFGIMLQPSSLLVRCRYYDQNPDIASYLTIFYSRNLADLLLLKDTRLCLDASGNLEDFILNGGETITLEHLNH